jgi:hypothetical protein
VVKVVLELAPQPVTVENVHGQHLLELPHEIARALGIMAMALQVGNEVPLPGNVLLGFGDVPFGLR